MSTKLVWAGWGALLGYALVVAPSAADDTQLLETLLSPDALESQRVFASLFNLMGVYPAIYAALLLPRAPKGKPKAWPFVVASFAFGAFALLPYFAFTLDADTETQGDTGVLESKLFAASLVAASAGLVGFAATAGPDAWGSYTELFRTSTLANVTTVDFVTLSAWAPFWCMRDAEARGAPKPSALTAIPAVGPAVYLLKRSL